MLGFAVSESLGSQHADVQTCLLKIYESGGLGWGWRIRIFKGPPRAFAACTRSGWELERAFPRVLILSFCALRTEGDGPSTGLVGNMGRAEQALQSCLEDLRKPCQQLAVSTSSWGYGEGRSDEYQGVVGKLTFFASVPCSMFLKYCCWSYVFHVVFLFSPLIFIPSDFPNGLNDLPLI